MQMWFCMENKYEFQPIAPAGPVIIDVLTDGLPRGVTDRHRAVWWVAVGRWRLAGLLEGGGRMLDALIPTRFLTTLAHLLAVIMLFSSKVRSVAMRARARAYLCHGAARCSGLLLDALVGRLCYASLCFPRACALSPSPLAVHCVQLQGGHGPRVVPCGCLRGRAIH